MPCAERPPLRQHTRARPRGWRRLPSAELNTTDPETLPEGRTLPLPSLVTSPHVTLRVLGRTWRQESNLRPRALPLSYSTRSCPGLPGELTNRYQSPGRDSHGAALPVLERRARDPEFERGGHLAAETHAKADELRPRQELRRIPKILGCGATETGAKMGPMTHRITPAGLSQRRS